MPVFAFYSVFICDVKRDVCSQESKSDVKQFQESWTTGLSVVMKELYVHSAVKMLFTVLQVFNVTLKPNTKNDSKVILRRMKLLIRQCPVTKNKVAFKKKPFAVQIKLRKVATKLQNVSPSAGNLLPMVISLKKNLSIAPKFSEDLPNRNVFLSRIKNLPVSV